MDIHITTENNGFDIALDGPDLAADHGLRTAVVASLFTDRRADNDDSLPGGDSDRRGCWMDMFDDHIRGSRLWLLSREKEMPYVLHRAREYAEEALQWLVDQGIALSIAVTAEWATDRAGVMSLNIAITLPNNNRFDDVFNYSLQAA